MNRRDKFFTELKKLCAEHQVDILASECGAHLPLIAFNFDYDVDDYGDFVNVELTYFGEKSDLPKDQQNK